MDSIVRITDVAPRDGLQNEPGVISTADKVELVRLLVSGGVDEVEVTSFVSPKWVPQLGDAAEVLAALADFPRGACEFSVLVPNEKGMNAALEQNARAIAHGGRRVIDKIAVFTAASETFSKRNTNATIAETLERFGPVLAAARAAGLATRGYVSCAVRCPFEGDVAPAAVASVSSDLLALGVDEIDLGDTIGAGTPESIAAMLDAVIARLGEAMLPRLTLHLHDTFGGAAACVRAALRRGLRSFDGSAGGLGGCPYASAPGRRAPGNIATELLVRTVRDAGFESHVDVLRLGRAGEHARQMANSE